MGNCFDLLSSENDPPLNPLPSPSPSPSPPPSLSPCSAPIMKRLPSTTHVVTPSKRPSLRFAPILPFRTPSDLAALYELGPELGRGQFGIIRKCASHSSGALFACKSISKLRLRTIHDIKDVVCEINIMKRLSNHIHPNGCGAAMGGNVVRLHEVIEDSTFVHLIIELCSGGELFDRIVKVKCYPEVQAALLMKSLLETLQFCHGMGIMHRDLKPENLLFVDDSEESVMKLADFGLAVDFSPGQKFSTMAGSAYYIAPEVLQGEYSEEIDMWSAGVIMYVLLSGVPPFWGQTEEGIFTAIQEGRIDLTSEPWKRISSSAKDLITRMLCVDVKLRWTPAQALEHPWIVLHTTKASTLLPRPIVDKSLNTMMSRDVELITDRPEVMSHDSLTLEEHANVQSVGSLTSAVLVDESLNMMTSRDVELITDRPEVMSHDMLTLEEHANVQSVGSLTSAVLVHLCDSTALHLVENKVQSDHMQSELKQLMVALVSALDKERLSFSESLSKIKMQVGWTCTLLTTSATEETLMVDMGHEKFLIAHDKLRKRLGWKVLRTQCFHRMQGKITSSGHAFQKLQPVF